MLLNVGELATLVQEKANVLIILMSDGGYGVIRNIQDAHFGARHYFVDLHNPDFAMLAKSLGLPHACVTDMDRLHAPLAELMAYKGPAMLEIDMFKVGPFAAAYAGPPDGKAVKAGA